MISGAGSHRSMGSSGSQTRLMQQRPPSGCQGSQTNLMQQRPPSGCSQRSTASGDPSVYLGPPEPPSARTGMMFSHSSPSLQPYTGAAEQVPVLKNVHMRRQAGPPEGIPKAVWSDGCAHLGQEDPWPNHSIPLWVFSGQDRPRPAYREEVRFTLRDETYINFAVRLRCGQGDHYNGGSVGIVHSPDRTEASAGSEGQLIMITDVIVQPNNTCVVTCIGDVNFRVKKAWMPRGLRGLQLAHVETEQLSGGLDKIVQTCATEPNMTVFARMLQAVPDVADSLQGGPFTVFVPTNEALANLGIHEDDLLQHPDLESLVRCHIVKGKITCEAMYSGRTLQAVDGTILQMTFARWPRGLPSVNEVPVEHLDVLCSNGVIHSVMGMLHPHPAHSRRRH